VKQCRSDLHLSLRRRLLLPAHVDECPTSPPASQLPPSLFLPFLVSERTARFFVPSSKRAPPPRSAPNQSFLFHLNEELCFLVQQIPEILSLTSMRPHPFFHFFIGCLPSSVLRIFIKKSQTNPPCNPPPVFPFPFVTPTIRSVSRTFQKSPSLIPPLGNFLFAGTLAPKAFSRPR